MLVSAHGQVVVASVLAGVSASHSGVSASRRLVGAGSEGARCWTLWVERAWCSFAFLSDTLLGKPRCDALQYVQLVEGGILARYVRSPPVPPPSHPVVSTCLSHQSSKRTGSSPPTPTHHVKHPRRNDRLTPHTPQPPVIEVDLSSLSRGEHVTRRSQPVRDPVVTYRIL